MFEWKTRGNAKMQKNKGISLIVLVITIIVMIILAASVVVSLNNTGIIEKANTAVQLTDERQVQDLAALVWAECYLDPVKKADIVNSVKTELANQGVTEDKWNITVTETGVTVTSKANWSVEDEYGYLSGNWKLNNLINAPQGTLAKQEIEFTIDGWNYTAISWEEGWGLYELRCYSPADDEWTLIYECLQSAQSPLWYTDSKTIIFTSKQQVSNEFYDWFTANATKIS